MARKAKSGGYIVPRRVADIAETENDITPITLRGVYRNLIPNQPPWSFLLWPPNVFALTSDVLSRTGAYYGAICPHVDDDGNDVGNWPPRIGMLLEEAKRAVATDIKKFRKWIKASVSNPTDVGDLTKLARHHERTLASWRLDKIALCANAATSRTSTETINVLGARKPNDEKDVVDPAESGWALLVQESARQWRHSLLKCFSPSVEGWIRFKGVCYSEPNGTLRTHELAVAPLRHLLQNTPTFVLAIWSLLRSHESGRGKGSLDDIHKHPQWVGLVALMTLHALADEACIGFGVWTKGEDFWRDDIPNQKLLSFVNDLMGFDGRKSNSVEGTSLSTIPASRLRVLPKRQTPEIGITLRSFSSHLGFHRSSVVVTWDKAEAHPMATGLSVHDRIAVLLLPWPLSVRALDFAPYSNTVPSMATQYGLFTFAPREAQDSDLQFERLLRHVLDECSKELERVDCVVLPEASITDSQRVLLERNLAKYRVSCYVAGVRGKKENGFPTNTVYCKQASVANGKLSYPGSDDADQSRWKRSKHHRWKLTQSQLTQYSLSYPLQGSKTWWEAIRIGRREVRFVNLGDRLTLCPLICEDLARQDPIADLIRTVGPSLVVTILMDGPQIVERWSARYASVLADDPGSAVLTLTSAGMNERFGPTELERARLGDRVRAVALWRDSGGSREITMSPTSAAVVLSLNVRHRRERVADGRREHVGTYDLAFGGVHQVASPSPRLAASRQRTSPRRNGT